MPTREDAPAHPRGFFARLLFGKPRAPKAPLPGYLEAMASGHTADSEKDLGEFIRRRSMDERGERRMSVESSPRASATEAEALIDAVDDAQAVVDALKAALEGREPRMELPELPQGLDSELSGPEAYLKAIPKNFQPPQ